MFRKTKMHEQNPIDHEIATPQEYLALFKAARKHELVAKVHAAGKNIWTAYQANQALVAPAERGRPTAFSLIKDADNRDIIAPQTDEHDIFMIVEARTRTVSKPFNDPSRRPNISSTGEYVYADTMTVPGIASLSVNFVDPRLQSVSVSMTERNGQETFSIERDGIDQYSKVRLDPVFMKLMAGRGDGLPGCIYRIADASLSPELQAKL